MSKDDELTQMHSYYTELLAKERDGTAKLLKSKLAI
jgi:hypothetical protein